MTREEALTRDGTLPYSRENLINQIFDEHEEELKKAYIDGSNSNNELIKFYLKRIEKLEKNA